MIRELSELGKTLRAGKDQNAWVHDALKEETITMVLTIRSDGSFVSLLRIENKKTMAEAVQRTSGKGARLLIDNCGYVIGTYDPDGNAFKKKAKEKGEQKAHEIIKKDVADKLTLFVERINELNKLVELEPILKFYQSNKHLGIDVLTQDLFLNTISKKDRGGNIAILISDSNKYVHEYDSVYAEVVDRYETKQRDLVSLHSKKCSVCSENKFPVGDFTHFPIKGVPGDKEPAGGRKLISYNGDNNPFESYEMTGNENCMICTNCAKTYVEGLNWLLTNGVSFKNQKNKDDILYSNRWPRKRSANFGLDTAMVFWTRNNQALDEIDQLEAPSADDVARMIESLASGKEKDAHYLEPERFYSCTLSGVAARIAVRDWIETSLGDFRTSITLWFRDIAVARYDNDRKEIVTHYAPLYDLARSCQRKNSDGSYDKDDTATARVASSLWKAALQNSSIPLWILTKVLQRARLDRYGVTTERAALIKLILNRNNKGGGFMITENKVEGDRPIAYICGQIFSKLESIQYHAASGDRNAGIRERYFTYAMTLPASAFGRLFDLSSKHYRKLKNEKPGLAVTLDKELQDLVKDIDINKLPATFSLEEKGQFAIGYYHQRQAQFDNAKSKGTKKEV
jgi:CRISPR-associated protein Csd1